MKPPMLSVVVPAYGVAEYLPACLDSILAQTLTDLEVIVVDDGSPDECGEIADSYAAHDPRVKVLHIPNGGVGPARNIGASVATGQYIAFADSDDLLVPRAYELMVSSLERSGSDFAASNAWRHIPGKGNVPSWTHRQAFAEQRIGTHLREFPLLIRDRMPWNKVYRRQFWVEGGYEFPAMRYEDYPVSMTVHLQAKAVDILPQRLYLWRQREAETSITQRSLDLDNCIDRVRSAEMVLDLTDGEGAGLIDAVHSYFIEVDLVTLATAIASADAAEKSSFVDLAVGLAKRLRRGGSATPRLARLIHECLLSGESELAAAMAKWRQDSDRTAFLRSLARYPSGVLRLPAALNAITRRRASASRLIRDRKLKALVAKVNREGEVLELVVSLTLRKQFLQRAFFGAELVSRDGVKIPLACEVLSRTGKQAQLKVLVPDHAAGALAGEAGRLVISGRLLPLSWRGGVHINVRDLPAPHVTTPGDWIVASNSASGGTGLWLRTVSSESMATPRFSRDELVVEVDDSHGFVAVLRPEPTPPLVARVSDGRASFRLLDLVNDPYDDPATSQAHRAVVAVPAIGRAGVQEAVQSVNDLVEEATAQGTEGTLSVVEEEKAAQEAEIDESIVEGSAELSDRDLLAEQQHVNDLSEVIVTPLVWVEVEDEGATVDTPRHRVTLRSSRSGNAEIFHRLLEYIE